MDGSARIESLNTRGETTSEEDDTCDSVKPASAGRDNWTFEEDEMPSYKEIAPSPEDGRYYCPWQGCSRSGIPDGRLFRKHMRTHHRPVKCPLCEVTGANQKDVRRHAEVHHLEWAQKRWEVRKFVCGSCGKEFKRDDHLKRHRRDRKSVV